MKPSYRGPLVAAATMLGIGLGGFLDGILLHQILQWHNMLSSKYAPTDIIALKYNMVSDGFFHAFTWLMTVVGLILLWRAAQDPSVPKRTPTFVGSLIWGWGMFNLVEGIIDHQVLGIHHVHPGVNELAWDLGFLALGAVQIVIGRAVIRAGAAQAALGAKL